MGPIKGLLTLILPNVTVIIIMKQSGGSIDLIALATLLIFLIPPFHLKAEIYQFVDADGVLHFTNVPTDPRYRSMGSGQRFMEFQSLKDIQQTILSAAGAHQIDPDLIRAVIKVESNFDAAAVSRAGAMGLMQLMPATALDLNVQNPFDPSENIRAGTKFLSELVNRFDGDIRLGLAAYHAGESRVLRYGNVPPIQQTQRYVKKVLKTYGVYQREADNRP